MNLKWNRSLVKPINYTRRTTHQNSLQITTDRETQQPTAACYRLRYPLVGIIRQRRKHKRVFNSLKWICELFMVPVILSQEVCLRPEWITEKNFSSRISEVGRRTIWDGQMSGISRSCSQCTEHPRTSTADSESRHQNDITEWFDPNLRGESTRLF